MTCALAAGGPTTSTNSPRVSSVGGRGGEFGDRRAQNLFMQLGQLAANGGVAAGHDLGEIGQRVRTRLPDSNITSVASIRASSVSRARRAPCLDGRNPSKKNRSVGSADTQALSAPRTGRARR